MATTPQALVVVSTADTPAARPRDDRPGPRQPTAFERTLRSSPAAFEAKLARARHLYEVAVLVHERAEVGRMESAPLAHRAITVLLDVLLDLHGEASPGEFAALARRASEVAAAQSFDVANLGEIVSTIDEMRARFESESDEVTRAEWRRYCRALQQVAELFEAVQSEFAALVPKQRGNLARYFKAAGLVTVAFALGGVFGARFLRSAPAAPAPAPPFGATFSTTLYKDEELREVAFTRSDTSIAFDWGLQAPEPLEQTDHFSVAWAGRLFVPTSGEYRFFLTSDDGSRLFIDRQLVVDNWGAHSMVTRETPLNLSGGMHAIRVEYFESTGGAMVQLEWSSDKFMRRVIVGSDLR